MVYGRMGSYLNVCCYDSEAIVRVEWLSTEGGPSLLCVMLAACCGIWQDVIKLCAAVAVQLIVHVERHTTRTQ
jgi:hypothetical protein